MATHVLLAFGDGQSDVLEAERSGRMPAGLDAVGTQHADGLDLTLEPTFDQAVNILDQQTEESARFLHQ